MDDNNPAITRVVEPEESKKMNIAQRLISLFVAPVELMRNIKRYPVVLVPLLIVTLLSLANLPFSFRLTDMALQWMSNLSLERYGVDYFNYSAYNDEAVTQAVTTTTSVTTIASAALMYPLIAFLNALGLWIITKIAKGSAKLGQYFSMYMHLLIITAIGSLIVTFACVQLETALDVTSLAAVLMPNGNMTMPLYNLLSAVTVFNIWLTVLACIGLKVINDFSTVKAVVITVIAYLLSVSITTASTSSTFLIYDFLFAQ